MMYTKDDMYNLLKYSAGVSDESISLVLQILGDTPQTYKKILTAVTEFKTFEELDESDPYEYEHN